MNNLELNSSLKGFLDSLLNLMKVHKNIVILNADFGRQLGLDRLSNVYPERCFNLGLQEENVVDIAVGFVVRGKIPVIVGLANFVLGKAWEQIRNMVCYPNLNIKIAVAGTGFGLAEDGIGFQANEDISLMRSLPNLKIASPADYNEAFSCAKTSIEEYGPVYIRLSEIEVPQIYEKDCRFCFEKSSVPKDGGEVCVFTCGSMTRNVLRAAEMLEEYGMKISVVNLSSLKPVDKNVIVSFAKKTNLLVVVEDHNVEGGLGTIVSEVLTEKYPALLRKIGPDRFGESGKLNQLYKKFGLTPEQIAERIKGFLKEF